MSSHREAPEISKDPSADNTDVYAFVDQNDPTKVNLIANFNPFELPYGGPNFNEFADDVLYTINIANRGKAQADISYQFRFKTTILNPNTFLYNTGPITKITEHRPGTGRRPTASRRSCATATARRRRRSSAATCSVPPCNVGVSSTPNYDATFTEEAIQVWALAGRCSPASAPTRSTSTSAASSTWAAAAVPEAPRHTSSLRCGH